MISSQEITSGLDVNSLPDNCNQAGSLLLDFFINIISAIINDESDLSFKLQPHLLHGLYLII